MFRKMKMNALLCVFPLLLAGCANYDVAGLLGGQPAAKSGPLNVSAYRSLGKKMTCTEIGNGVSKAYQLNKKGKSKEDIYWAITPESSTYIQQDIYLILIDVGMSADAKSSTLFKQACQANLETYQEIYDESSRNLFSRVDLIYNEVRRQELATYRESLSGIHSPMYRFGSSKAGMRNEAIQDESYGDLDDIANEVNNMVYEKLLDILYKPEYMKLSEHPDNILPPLESVRRQMAPELVVQMVK